MVSLKALTRTVSFGDSTADNLLNPGNNQLARYTHGYCPCAIPPNVVVARLSSSKAAAQQSGTMIGEQLIVSSTSEYALEQTVQSALIMGGQVVY